MSRKLPFVPSRNVLAVAVLGSLFAHLLFFSQATSMWSLPDEHEMSSPLEVSLSSLPAVKPAPAPVDAPVEMTKATQVPSTAPVAKSLPQVPLTLPVMADAPPVAVPQTSSAVPEAQPAVSDPEIEPVIGAAMASAIEPVIKPLSPPRVRNLPGQLRLVYDVQSGEEGFNLGQAVYTWFSDGLTYALQSTAEAQGVVSLFMSGSIVQSSRGRIGADGLLPEHFFMEKGGKRKDTARFDWSRQQLILPAGNLPLPIGTQDTLSFPFHWAHTLSGERANWTIPVTNGRKLKEYAVDVVGREHVKVGTLQLETLHIQAKHVVDGSLDVWLAPSRHWLPVRIRSMDQKGKVLVLTLQPTL